MMSDMCPKPNQMQHLLLTNFGDMSVKCMQNVKKSMILEKMCHYVAFCLAQTQNLPVIPGLGGELLQTDPPSKCKQNLGTILCRK